MTAVYICLSGEYNKFSKLPREKEQNNNLPVLLEVIRRSLKTICEICAVSAQRQYHNFV